MSKKHKILFLCDIAALCLCGVSINAFAGIGNPTAPVSSRTRLSPTTPVSSYSSTFVTAPAQPNSNLIMTGNVPGLAYFHGSLPYSNPDYFMGTLPSTTVDVFRRYTAPAGQPFYSPTATSPDFFASQAYQQNRIKLNAPQGQIPYPLLSPTTPPSQATSVKFYASAYDLYNRGLLGSVAGYKNPDLFINLPNAAKPLETVVPQEVIPLPPEIQTVTAPAENAALKLPEKSMTSSDQIKQQIEELNKLLEQPSTSAQANTKLEESIEKSWQDKLKSYEQENAKLSERLKKLLPAEPAKTRAAPSEGGAPAPKVMPITPEEQKYLESKIADEMAYGWKLLKEQQFYQAADAFTTASLYEPHLPEAYGGKAIALFASGSYMYASQVLALALEVSPDYTKTNLDIADLIGSKAKLDERITDLQKFASQNNSGQLYFLLAFVQFKTNQLPQSKTSIDQALKLMPDTPAFKILKSAIDTAPAK